ncbi:hypothetical protein Salat_2761800 [Sesamum alatum]|uniref:Uncharacterized protein n=1 Tax=Sesamum alatum TaxID=300844 RepID=A0AAE2C915_9LAMI|nr:hypothetical protein Salat_2761800 [Sesamum alatum]
MASRGSPMAEKKAVEDGGADDASVNCDKVETWERKKLKDQFLQHFLVSKGGIANTKTCSNGGDYVKDFISLMLNMKDMSDKDKLFNVLAICNHGHQVSLGDNESNTCRPLLLSLIVELVFVWLVA